MAVQHDAKANDNNFVSLKLVKGKEWMAKDSGERGGQLEESYKDCVPNPEAPRMPMPKLRKGGY